MIKISSERELLESFRIIDRPEVELPKNLQFPLIVKDYLSWTEPSGYRTFLVFSDQPKRPPLGIVFRRDQSSGGSAARMCEWCHSVGSGDEVSLLTASASSNRRIGIYLCRDVSCNQKVNGSPGVNDVPTFSNSRDRVRKIVGRISVFARREIF